LERPGGNVTGSSTFDPQGIIQEAARTPQRGDPRARPRDSPRGSRHPRSLNQGSGGSGTRGRPAASSP
jgi:hypothetical protein